MLGYAMEKSIPDCYTVLSRERNYTVVRGPSRWEKYFLIHSKDRNVSHLVELTKKEFHFYGRFSFHFFSIWTFLITCLLVVGVFYSKELEDYISLVTLVAVSIFLIGLSLLISPLRLIRYIRKLPPYKKEQYIALTRHFANCRNIHRARVAKLVLPFIT